MTPKYRLATMSAAERLPPGWPEPAAASISMTSRRILRARLATSATSIFFASIVISPLRPARFDTRSESLGVAWELEVRQSDPADEHLVGAQRRRRSEAGGTARADQVVLLDAVAADAGPADHLPVLPQRGAPGKEHDTALIGVRGLGALRAGRRHVIEEERKEGPRPAAIDARWVQRLGPEADRPVRDLRAERHAREVGARTGRAAEVDDVARFRRRHVDAEDRRVRHAEES